MKILKKGGNSWIGKIITCGYCKCQIELEEGDEVQEVCIDEGCFLDENGKNCPIHRTVISPNCREKISFHV